MSVSCHRIKHLADPTQEHLGGERLLEEELNPRLDDAVANDAVVSVARHEQYLHCAARRGESFSEFPAAHSRHHDIGQQDVDRTCKLLRGIEGLDSIRCLNDVISRPAKNRTSDDAELRLIFDE